MEENAAPTKGHLSSVRHLVENMRIAWEMKHYQRFNIISLSSVGRIKNLKGPRSLPMATALRENELYF